MEIISPNRQALKDLANFNIDSQFCQQYGTHVFNHSGGNTATYQQVRAHFEGVVDDLADHLQKLKQQIPVVGRE